MASLGSQTPTVLGDLVYDTLVTLGDHESGHSLTINATTKDPSQLSQALRQRASSDKSFQFTASPDRRQPIDWAFAPPEEEQPNRERRSPQAPAVPVVDPPPSQQHDTTRRPTKYAKSSLPVFHSAPNTTGVVMDKEGRDKMHYSYGDRDGFGDTQPDSQLYKNYTSNLGPDTSHAAEPNCSLPSSHSQAENAETPAAGVESVESSQQRDSPTITSPTIAHEDDDDDARFPADQAPTSPLKFATPALASRKRDSEGQALSSAIRTNTTPGTVLSASAFFDAGTGIGGLGQPMSLTQAFNATQAATSPAVGVPSEDAVFQRPSPNFTRARFSSPILAMSSPIKANPPEMAWTDPILRSSSEPRSEYVTMKESQERRRQEVEREGATADQQDSWEQPTTAERRAARRRARQRFERETASSFRAVSAPTTASEPARRAKKHGSTPPHYPSPAKSRSTRPEGGNNSHLEVQDSPSGGEDDDNPPDEQSHARASRSPSVAVKVASAQHSSAHTGTNNKIQVPHTSSHPHSLTGPNPSQRLTPTSQSRRVNQSQLSDSQILPKISRQQSSKESAVMDSQPETTLDSHPRPRPLQLPSTPSTNHYSINQTTMASRTGYTSQIVPSSMPPMPPQSSSQIIGSGCQQNNTADEEYRVPSSPPVLHEDDDITYDEHSQADDEDEPQVSEARSDNDEVSMDEGDAVPSTKNEGQEDELKFEEHSEVEYPDLDAAEAVGKVDWEDENEIPDTMDLQNPKEDNGHRSTQLPEEHDLPDPVELDQSHVRRQSTIPETDMVEGTQPPSFVHANSASHGMKETSSSNAGYADASGHAGSTEAVYTANENQNQSGFEQNKSLSQSSRVEILEIAGRNSHLTLQDIAELPETQYSTDLNGIDIPQLSNVGQIDDDSVPGSSPAMPPAKRRKATHGAEKKTFCSPVEETDPVSESNQISPIKQPQQVQEETPSSTPRSKAGSLRKTPLEETVHMTPVAMRAKGFSKPSKSQSSKTGALKPVNRALFSTSSPSPSNLETQCPTEETDLTAAQAETDVGVNNVGNTDDELDELAGPTPQTTYIKPAIETTDMRGEPPTGDIIAHNRVFAQWPGGHYYTSTCIGRVDSRNLLIRYDDSNEYTLENAQVRALDLRPGDQVKVDQHGMKQLVYIVVGLAGKMDEKDLVDFSPTDRRGYASVVLEERPRASLPKPQLEQARRFLVPITWVYLTKQLWGKMRDRTFRFPSSSSAGASTSQLAIPNTNEAALAVPSASRRCTTRPAKGLTAHAVSTRSSVYPTKGLFKNMAFAITMLYDEKSDVVKIIEANGGQVLDNGFHELFNLNTAGRRTQAKSKGKTSSPDGFVLKETSKALGFVALLSSTHSRSTKQVQALALNIPVLHQRWIYDSVSISRPLPFAKYLLPAGVSKVLSPLGVVRSRVMKTYDPAADNVCFSDTIAQRDLLLHNQSVLIVKRRSAKDASYLFLTHALGPTNVGFCSDLLAAKKMVKDGKWDWIYVEDGSKGVVAAQAELFGVVNSSQMSTVAKSGSKKRKRDESSDRESGPLVCAGTLGNKKVRVVCDEFVVQSLILGALVEE